MSDRLLTAKQVCDKLQIKLNYLYRLTHLGLIPHVKICGQLRFLESKVDAWILSQQKGGDANANLQSEV